MKHIIESTDILIIDGWNDGKDIYIGVAEADGIDIAKTYPIAVLFCDAKGYSEYRKAEGRLMLNAEETDYCGVKVEDVPALQNELVAVKIILGAET